MLARAATAAVSAAGPAVPALFRPRPSVLRALRAGTAATMATKAKGPTIKTRRDFVYYPDEALQLLKLAATAKFDESIDIAIQMGVDPRKAGENLRGVAQLPAGTGKTVRIAVFARGDKAEEARAAGADIVGAEELVELVQSGGLQADKVIATPDVMPLVGRVGRILGPRGLMPNPKLGTVTMDVTSAVSNARKGQVSFRVEKQAIIHAPLGRVSFSDEAILSNLRALVLAINALKPEGFKGDFFRHATMSSTMGPGVHIDVTTIDPSRARFSHTSGQYRDPKLEELGSALKVDAVALMARHRRGEPVRA